MAREDLNPVEEARACATLVEDLGSRRRSSAAASAASRVAVSNLIRLLDLPDDVLALLESGELSEGHGRAILMLQGPRRTPSTGPRRAANGPGRCAKPSAAPTRPRSPSPRRGTGPVPLHPDLADALAARRGRALRRPRPLVRVRAHGGAFRVEFELERPDAGVELAERLLRRRAARRSARLRAAEERADAIIAPPAGD